MWVETGKGTINNFIGLGLFFGHVFWQEKKLDDFFFQMTKRCLENKSENFEIRVEIAALCIKYFKLCCFITYCSKNRRFWIQNADSNNHMRQ